MRQHIKSPLNYTGNKYRLLGQFEEFFPDKCKVFVDLFCGGATVGFNVNAEKIILIDKNAKVINLLECLAKEDIDKIISQVEYYIDKYKLSYSRKLSYKHYRDNGFVIGNNGLKEYNKDGYLKLRNDYNELEDKNSFESNIMLYTLMVYAFNNDIRFNRNGNFNLPVGKTDFNNNNYKKLVEFNTRAREINFEFICGDFKDEKIRSIILSSDFVYSDPPYLITDAVYNEQSGWTNEDEETLLALLDRVNQKGGKFALSNVIRKRGAENTILNNWATSKNYRINPINYHYRSASYNKKDRLANEEEVLIVN